MKILRILMVASAAIFVVPAQAQTSGTVTNHAFAIGKGAGQTGFTSLLCAATELAVGQDAANPACKELSGDITMDADGVTTIGTNKVTNGMLRQSGALSLIGRSVNSTGNVADISAVAGSGCAYREASNTIGCGQLATAALGVNIVTNAKLAQMANGTTKCRTTAGTGDPEDCSASQMRSLLSLVVGTNVQAWDTDLDCYAALSGTGIIRRTGSGTCSNGTAVANSELATMANGTIKGNVSGSSATPSDITPSQALDVIGTTRGSILYRGASGWALLTPGTSGQILTSNGAGADPSYQDAAGGGGGSDTDRRNALLTLIYQSKVFAVYRRVVNTFATGFKGSNDTDYGINTGSSSNYSVTAGSAGAITGYVAPTATTLSRLTGGTPAMPKGGTAANINDNNPATKGVTGSSIGNMTGASIATRIIAQVDYGSNKTISKIEVVGYKDNGSGSNSGHQLVYSTDGTNWTQLGASITTNQTPQTFSSTGSITARYIALAVSAQSWGSITLELADLNGYEPLPDDMTVVTTSQIADTSVNNARVLLEYDNSASPTLDTDLTAEVTCDGGSNWASAALSAVTSNSQAGRKVAESDDTSCTSGTSFAARIKTLNNKNVPIYGASVTAR